MQFQFTVSDDLPAKKDGANSMWATPTQAKRLARLCEAAAQAPQGHPPLRRNIRLIMMARVGPVNHKSVG
jgi:hypothetical protein